MLLMLHAKNGTNVERVQRLTTDRAIPMMPHSTPSIIVISLALVTTYVAKMKAVHYITASAINSSVLCWVTSM